MNRLMLTIPLALLLAASLPAASRASDGPLGLLEQIGVEQRLGQALPTELVFQDERGDDVELASLFRERPVLLVPVYYECPMLCGEVLRGLVKTFRPMAFEVGLDFDVIAVSFDPGETAALAAAKRAEVLEDYGNRGNPDGWHFLTGNAAPIRTLMESVGFEYAYDEVRDEYAHASLLILATPDGRVSRYFFGIDYAPRDLRLGLVKASNGTIGGVVDQVLLYCYHYDPLTGKYGLLIMRVLQLSGGATVALLGGFMGLSFWRDRKRALAGRADAVNNEIEGVS